MLLWLTIIRTPCLVSDYSCRYLCWWCSSCVLHGAAVRIDQAVAKLRVFLKTGPLSKRGVLSTVFLLIGSLTSPSIRLSLLLTFSCVMPQLTQLPPAENFSFPDGTKRATPSAPQGAFEEIVWFSLPFRSLVRQRGQTTTCSQSRNAAALPPLPFMGLQQPVYEEVMSTRGDRRESHIVAFDARQDMRCVVIPKSMLLSLKTSESQILVLVVDRVWPDRSDMKDQLWPLLEPLWEHFWDLNNPKT